MSKLSQEATGRRGNIHSAELEGAGLEGAGLESAGLESIGLGVKLGKGSSGRNLPRNL